MPGASHGRVTLQQLAKLEEVFDFRLAQPADGVARVVDALDQPFGVELVERLADRLAPGGLELQPGGRKLVAAEYFAEDQKMPQYVEGLPLKLPKGFPWQAEKDSEGEIGHMHLKLFASLAPVDLTPLTQEASRGESSMAGHPLERAAARLGPEGTRGFEPEETAEVSPAMDWNDWKPETG